MKTSILILSMVLVTNVQAQYIDPGSGSYIFQIIVGVITAILFWWKSIVRYFQNIKNKSDKIDTNLDG